MQSYQHNGDNDIMMSFVSSQQCQSDALNLEDT